MSLVLTSTPTRTAKRLETTRRLARCALELCDERGFDGWTIDELAARAEVSRRTVFNYFDSKADVVLGPVHELPPDALQAFREGGPTGNLLEDVIALAAQVMQDKAVDLDLVTLRRSAIRNDPQLAGLLHARFEEIVEQFADDIVARGGEEWDADGARLLIRLLVTIFDHALQETHPPAGTSLDEFLRNAIAEARAVLTL